MFGYLGIWQNGNHLANAFPATIPTSPHRVHGSGHG